MNKFTPTDYPKSFASVRKGDFRLKAFMTTRPMEVPELSNQLYLFCDAQADTVKPLADYNGLPYIGSGWEWSVFRKNPQTAVKVPAGIFAEVNDPRYLENSRMAYEMIKEYFPANFIAETTFQRVGNTTIIEQEFINGMGLDTVPFETNDQVLLGNLEELLLGALRMLDEQQWMPDFWFGKNESGFEVNNIVIEAGTKLPKIIDFTYYFDPYRIYPEKMEQAIAEHRAKAEEFLEWVRTKRAS